MTTMNKQPSDRQQAHAQRLPTCATRQYPGPKTIVSTHNGIYLHNKKHLPPQQTAFANTTKHILVMIYPRTQRHLPPQPKVFAPTTKGICPHNQTRGHWPLQPNSHASTMPGHSAWKSFTPSRNASRNTRNQMAFANTIKGMCPRTRWHLPPQPNSHTSRKVSSVCSKISITVDFLV